MLTISLNAKVILLTEANFDETLKSSSYLVAGVFQRGCHSCLLAKTLIYELDLEYGELVTFGLIDYEKNKELAKQLKTRAFPSLYFYKEGKLNSFHAGPILQGRFENLLTHLLTTD